MDTSIDRTHSGAFIDRFSVVLTENEEDEQ